MQQIFRINNKLIVQEEHLYNKNKKMNEFIYKIFGEIEL